MFKATAENLGEILPGKEPAHEATWNAICITDFAERGGAFVTPLQIPPRNVNWSLSRGWVHPAKEGFEKYVPGKIRAGKSETFYEKAASIFLKTYKLKAD